MENLDAHLQHLTDLSETLSPDRLAEIDFDQLRTTLDRQRELLAEHTSAITDLAVLRRDYIDRIAGMAKAIAVVAQHSGLACRTDCLRRALDYIVSLESLSADQLIKHYRLTCAGFRDAFPTTFAHLQPRRS